mmetsp:Transcript_27125/g.61804  ORF Transcript_27125/g.61804 Transcript_27125/m.61804 type:complete len:96 (+) Transcript_27125:73-360(+)
MADAGGDGAAASSAAAEPPQERSCARDCGEGTLDCFAFFGRGVVNTGRGCYTVTKHAAYPVKEGCLKTRDACSTYLHPYQLKKPAGSDVPTFKYG